MITKAMIRDGIKSGKVGFVVDPNMDHGTVCKIGDCWFYFGGLEAEQENPDDYTAHVPQEDIIDEIFDVLDEFHQLDDFVDEYNYYEAVLR